jgi:hypothetical protein
MPQYPSTPSLVGTERSEKERKKEGKALSI